MTSPKRQSKSKRRAGSHLVPNDPNAVWTYRYFRFGEAREKHFPSEDEAVQQALQDIDGSQADPEHIRIEGRIVHDSADLYDSWAEKYL